MPHIEIVQTGLSTSAPGWAYVLDRAVDPSKIALNPSSTSRNKGGRAQRAIATTNITNNELSRRETIAIQRRLADLDKDGGKDVPVPAKWRDFGIGTEGGGVGSWGKGRKMTTNARRVLLSEKTFEHYLNDEEARLALGAVTVVGGSASGGRRSEGGMTKRESLGGKRESTAGVPPSVDVNEAEDVEMVGVSQERGSAEAQEDDNTINAPFFKIDVPTTLTEEELETLLSAPPLPYNAARAAPPSANAPPQRKFCEMCGYWGQVKCLKCGSRVCGLDCKRQHDVDCRKRFA